MEFTVEAQEITESPGYTQLGSAKCRDGCLYNTYIKYGTLTYKCKSGFCSPDTSPSSYHFMQTIFSNDVKNFNKGDSFIGMLHQSRKNV